MPLRTAARRTRFKAKETHCPASAVVTFALVAEVKTTEHAKGYHCAPFPLHALDHGGRIIAIRVRPQHHCVTSLHYTRIDDAIYDGPHIRNGPNFSYRVLAAVSVDLLSSTDREGAHLERLVNYKLLLVALAGRQQIEECADKVETLPSDIRELEYWTYSIRAEGGGNINCRLNRLHENWSLSVH